MHSRSSLGPLAAVLSLMAGACSAGAPAGDRTDGNVALSGRGGSSSSVPGGSSSPPLSLGGRLESGGQGNPGDAAAEGAPVEILTTLPDGFTKAATEMPDQTS